jgi:Raf kinase inhibitor-like YbhB/YbcL family protein
MTVAVTRPSFQNGALMPDVHAKEHGNVSPALDWSGAPDGTESYAIIVRDPDAPKGTVTHWAVADIPAQQLGVVEGDDLSAFTVLSDVFGDSGYGGPRPPAGDDPHHYHFRVLALVAEAETIGIHENEGS